MWPKIRRFPPPIPVAVKLTVFYAVILCAILALTSLLTLGGVRYYLGAHAQKDMDAGRDNVLRYLAAGGPVDERLLGPDLLPAGVALASSMRKALC